MKRIEAAASKFVSVVSQEIEVFDMFAFEPTSLLRGADDGLALGVAFVWGLGSALLSPCHLGIIPVLGSHAAGYGPFSSEKTGTGTAASLANQAVRQALLFTLGVFLTIPLLGFFMALLGHGLELGGHFWTIPAGAVLVWFGWDIGRGHSCSHAAHILETLRKRLGLTLESGIFALGFGYGLLAGGCTVGFLVPLLLVALPGGILYSVGLAACFGLGHCLPMILVGCSAPLAKKMLQNRHAHHAHANEEAHATDGNTRDPHSGEVLFRRILSGLLMIIGLVFVLHPFLE